MFFLSVYYIWRNGQDQSLSHLRQDAVIGMKIIFFIYLFIFAEKAQYNLVRNVQN